ncbi:MAG: PLP-dependent aminotransferase family protein [Phaeovulum sp.]|uniref:aminotransferase-like domain-containing protein n=1 Tax=Phaeovulum sp. TaxID=2934796 RepID=UPI0027349336|nr:PLP-dependent aminotransferase family protein [Phaeovulum sp.]MDP3862095.1 PLP-dependent aminotransferase family protein [Phaeovulum sp.]
MDTNWRPDLAGQTGPKYLALLRALREDVRGGRLAEGCRLPPVRALAWSLGITPGTVARAYQIGTQEGLLCAVVGRGTFVASASPRLGPREPLHIDRLPDLDRETGPVDLRSPQLPDVGQTEALSRVMIEAAGQIGADYLEYPGLRRDSACRRAVVDWLSCCRLGPLTEEDLVLTHGGQNGINIVLSCCLRGERPVVLAEALAYPGFRHAARLQRAEVVPVALDAEGMRPDALDAACRRHGGQVVCIAPEAQNPTTARMGLARREEIAAVARAHDLQILEDDCYTMPSSGLPALRALAPERCWHVASLSKPISAGLRFGMVACPTGMGETGRLAAQHSYFGLARPVTDIVTRLLVSGEAARLRVAAQVAMTARQGLAVAALGQHDLAWQPGLTFLWLRLPSGWRASTFTRMAEAEGVLLRSADEYALVDGHAPNAVRIALAGGISEERFNRALATLARLLANPPGDLPV